jgi:hypothetical protein
MHLILQISTLTENVDCFIHNLSYRFDIFLFFRLFAERIEVEFTGYVQVPVAETEAADAANS